MIKRENIKQAIDAISKRDPEIGYSLNEMLGTGKIDMPSQADVSPKGEDPCFFFDKEKVSINKFLYFNEGTVPIEQGLLIKYGEMIKRQELLNRAESPDYKQVVIEIRKAGLKFMVTHEIDYVLARLRKSQGMPEKNQRMEVSNHVLSNHPLKKQSNHQRKQRRNCSVDDHTAFFTNPIQRINLNIHNPKIIDI